MPVEWFLKDGNEERGPISSSHLKLLADQRAIAPDTLVRLGKSGEWMAASTIEGLFTLYEHARPAPSTGSPPVRPSSQSARAGGGPAEPAARDSPAERRVAQQAVKDSGDIAGVGWYIQAPDGHQYGPVTKAQVDAWAAEGRVHEAHLLWRAGWDQWRWAGAVYPQLARHGPPPEPEGHSEKADRPAGFTVAHRMSPSPAATAGPAGAPPGSPEPTPRATAKADGLAGQILGRFEVGPAIGHGALGTVYKARHPALDRFVALRVLPELRDPQFVERFRRELRAAAALNHPNIVGVHDMGEDRGCAFIAMELVEGESLADMMRREGRVPVVQALEIMKQVVAALGVAHASGVIHRDIKPSNILISQKGLAKLGDFGMALRSETDVTSATGTIPASAHYLPPEAARGEPLDARSDLYSLGATFYHALAGRPPFSGPSGAELARRHAEMHAPPLAQTAPDLPPSLASVVDHCLAKDPCARFESAGELLAALNQVAVPRGAARPDSGIPHDSMSDTQPPGGSRTLLWVIAASAGGLVLLLLAAAVVIYAIYALS